MSNPYKIPFNKPFFTGNELSYIEQAVASGKISGDGMFTKKCHAFFERKFGFKKALLTTSCTDALELAAILIDTKPGDEVIVPSYTFVSTVNAFVLRGAKIVFVDSLPNHPNMDVSKVEGLITSKTKAIVPVHYAGVACDMDELMRIADKHGLFVIEDAAQAIDSYYKGRPLGGIGHFGAFSFHETKNIISGEGGLLVINDARYIKRAEIVREKGTNRTAFFRGEVDKYGWVDIGSSFLPSDVIAAFLLAQLESMEIIQKRRKEIWSLYRKELSEIPQDQALQPKVAEYATNNAHMYYLVLPSQEKRKELISELKLKGIYAVFHYLSLHKSVYYAEKHDGRALPNCDRYADRLVRLPLFFELKDEEVLEITKVIKQVLC